MTTIREALAPVESELGIPVESMAAVMFAESGLRPDSRNPKDRSTPVAAAGLIQLTRGANLPGFSTSEAIESVTSMGFEEQIRLVVLPYYRRIPSARGASPCKLRMLNFLASHANDTPSTIIASRGDAIYSGNWGFDRGATSADSGGKGYITVGDVCDSTESALAAARSMLDTPLSNKPSSTAVSRRAKAVIGMAIAFVALGTVALWSNANGRRT